MMLARKGRHIAALMLAGLLVAGSVAVSSVEAQEVPSGRIQAAKKEKKIAAGEKEAKKLILLMDKDQNGKLSKQEFMGFMEAEFDRLDKDKRVARCAGIDRSPSTNEQRPW